MRPKISVILPVLNCFSYIRESVESVLSQTMLDVELIAIDAGSTDGTFEELRKYQNQNANVKLLQSEIKSVGYQSNLGLEAAEGEYIGFLEDDYLASDMCQILYNIAGENDLDWIKGDYTMFMDINDKRYYLDVSVIKDKSLKNTVFAPYDRPEILRWDANHWKGIYKRDFLINNNIRFNETPGAAFQDTGFVWQTYINGKRCMYIDKPVYYYRRNNRESSTFSQNGLKFFLDEFEYILDRTKECDNRNSFLKNMYLRALMMLFSQSEKLPDYKQQSEQTVITVKKLCDHINEAELNGIISQKDVSPEQWINYKVASKDPEVFLQYYPIRKKCEDEKNINVLKTISRFSSIVLCGYGLEAKKWEIFILCNCKNKEVTIADNNEKKQGRQSANGLQIGSFKDAIDKYPDALFLITSMNTNTRENIETQLIKEGISRDHIYSTDIWLHPYTATTVYEQG